jgi:hypothetical protein
MARNQAGKIVLVAGPVRQAGRDGHHGYIAGCHLLATLLGRLPGVAPVVVEDGWPVDESVFDEAVAVLFYDNGGGKQGFLANADRRACLERLAATGCGLGVMHQAAGFPSEYLAFGKQLFGGVYVGGQSNRGHWRSRHERFPEHAITRYQQAWRLRDGWLNHLQFVDDEVGVTPLLWSDRRLGSDPQAGTAAVVSWACERSGGGRSFVFTGLDNHRAWEHFGLRQLVANGVLWSAGQPIPDDPAWLVLSSAEIAAFRTPRVSPLPRAVGSLGRKVRRAVLGQRKW